MSVIGHMVCLWTWALDNAPDGDLTDVQAVVIATGAEWTGDAGAFVEALVEVGFLDRSPDSLQIHNWDDYAGKLIARRTSDRERKRALRASAGNPEDVRRKSAPTVPYPTVPNRTDKSTRVTVIDEEYILKKIEEFKSVWGEEVVRGEIAAACGHKAYNKWDNKQLYVSRWLGKNARDKGGDDGAHQQSIAGASRSNPGTTAESGGPSPFAEFGGTQYEPRSPTGAHPEV